MAAPNGTIVDHINGDILDNRRENLRFVTASENAINSRHTVGKSGYRGVICPGDQRFLGWVVLPLNAGVRKRLYTSAFRTAAEAARARDALALEVYGPLAKLNFPQERAA
jgi:hypothetical protein